MKARIRHLYETIAGALLPLLGCSSTSCDLLEPRAEYGMPHADYHVIGNVHDEAGTAIPGIEVRMGLWSGEYETASATAATDGKGNFEISLTEFPWQKAVLNFTDIDGEANGGEFGQQSQDVDLDKTRDGDGNWNFGRYDGSVDVTLKPKE